MNCQPNAFAEDSGANAGQAPIETAELLEHLPSQIYNKQHRVPRGGPLKRKKKKQQEEKD